MSYNSNRNNNSNAPMEDTMMETNDTLPMTIGSEAVENNDEMIIAIDTGNNNDNNSSNLSSPKTSNSNANANIINEQHRLLASTIIE